MYETIKKFLAEGSKCLLIENGKPTAVILTLEEYELLRSKSSSFAKASEDKQTDLPHQTPPYQGRGKEEVAANLTGEAIVKVMDSPEASAELSDIASADDITLEDLGLDELPY